MDSTLDNIKSSSNTENIRYHIKFEEVNYEINLVENSIGSDNSSRKNGTEMECQHSMCRALLIGKIIPCVTSEYFYHQSPN